MLHKQLLKGPRAHAWCTLMVVLSIQLIHPAVATDGNDDPARDIGTASSFTPAFIDSANSDSDSNYDGGGGKKYVFSPDDDGDGPDTKPWDYGSDRRDDPTNYTLMKNDPDSGPGGRDRQGRVKYCGRRRRRRRDRNRSSSRARERRKCCGEGTSTSRQTGGAAIGGGVPRRRASESCTSSATAVLCRGASA